MRNVGCSVQWFQEAPATVVKLISCVGEAGLTQQINTPTGRVPYWIQSLPTVLLPG